MESGFRTPLLDCFRRGEVTRDIRLLAARGALAPRALEQLALLVLLVGDQDAEVASLAAATLDGLPPAAVAKFIGRSEVSDDIRAFFIARGIQPIASATPAKDDDEPLIETGAEEAAAEEADEEKTRLILNMLPVPQRLKFALKGTASQRAVLVRDPNKVVSAAVLSSPKLTESEVEAFARMANVSEETLRTIGTSRAWTKSYSVVSGLVRNPKCPPAISLTLISRLNDRDVKGLVTDRNVPEVLRLAARKVMAVNQSRKQ